MNGKILRWRQEFSSCQYNIHYRQGSDKGHHESLSTLRPLSPKKSVLEYKFALLRSVKQLLTPSVPCDTLSRVCSATTAPISLEQIHDFLCHRAVKTLNHFIQMKILSFSLEDVKEFVFSVSFALN